MSWRSPGGQQARGAAEGVCPLCRAAFFHLSVFLFLEPFSAGFPLPTKLLVENQQLKLMPALSHPIF